MTASIQLLSERFGTDNLEPCVRLSDSQLSIVAELRRVIESGELRMVPTSCLCGSNGSGTVIAQRDRYGFRLTSVLCAGCGTVRFDPYFDADSTKIFYTRYYQQLYGRLHGPASRWSKQERLGHQLLRAYEHQLPQGGWVCEIGCGAGGSLYPFHERGYQTIGCDYSADLVEYGTSRGGSTLVQGAICDLKPHLQDKPLDFIFLYHVFEHVDDPVALLSGLKEHLSPRGKIAIIVPDIARIGEYSRPDHDALLFLHIAHKYNLTRQGLSSLADRVGLHFEDLGPHLHRPDEGPVPPAMWVEMSAEKQAREHSPVGCSLLNYLQHCEAEVGRRRHRRVFKGFERALKRLRTAC